MRRFHYIRWTEPSTLSTLSSSHCVRGSFRNTGRGARFSYLQKHLVTSQLHVLTVTVNSRGRSPPAPVTLMCSTCRSGDLLQHAGVSGWSVVGHAGGQDLPALPQRRGSHAGPQVLLGLFQMVRSKPLLLQVACCHMMALFRCWS